MYKTLEGVTTSAEAMAKAGLNWNVKLTDIYTPDKLIPGKKAIVRETDGLVYGIVSDRYMPVQHPDAFAWFDGAVTAGQATYEVVGNVDDGGRVWIEARLPNVIGILGEEIRKYILLVNSHNGTSALQIYYTTIRVVCQNRLAMAKRKADFNFYARHTSNVHEKMNTAQNIMGLAGNYFANWQTQAQRLAEQQLPGDGFERMMNAAFGKSGLDELSDIEQRDKVAVGVLLKSGKGMDNPAIQGTKWAAYNALVEHIDYNKTSRGSEDAHTKNVMFGVGAAVKERAWDYLLRN